MLKNLSPSYLWIFGAQLAALLLLGCHANLRGLPLDDAWIHVQIAQTFVESGTLGFVAGQFGSGATSLLWPALLSISGWTGLNQPVLFGLALNCVLYLWFGWTIWKILNESGFSKDTSTVGTLGAVLVGNLVWFAFSGMEAMLVLALCSAAVRHWHKPDASNAWLSATYLAAAFLTRTETAIFALPMFYERFRLDGKFRSAHSKAMLIVLGSVALITLSTNLALTGHATPGTLAGRRWMWLLSATGSTPGELAFQFFMQWLDRINQFSWGLGSPYIFWPSCAISIVGFTSILCKSSDSPIRTLLLGASLHLALYAVLLPATGHGGRYQPFTPAFAGMTLLIGIQHCARALESSGKSFAAKFCTVAFITPILITTASWGYDHAAAVEHIQNTEVEMGKALKELPSDAKIASFDIGAIRYFSGRQILDLGALSDPSVINALKDGTIIDWLQHQGVDFVVVPRSFGSFPDYWNFIPILGLDPYIGEQLTPQISFITPPETWAQGVRATLHCAPAQQLFSINQ